MNRGECCVCRLGAKDMTCLAGHGDDDYSKATKEQVIQQLDEGRYANYRGMMIGYLKSEFDYDYCE